MFRRTFFDSFIFAYLGILLLIAIAQPSGEQMMRLSENFAYFLVAMVLGAALSYGLNKSKSPALHTLGETLFEPAYKKAVKIERSWYKTFSGWQLLLFLIVTFIVGVKTTKVSITELLDEDGFAGAMRLFHGLFSPNLDILPKAVLNIIETVFMAFMATSLAIPVAFVMSFFCARNIMKGPVAYTVYMTLRTLLNFTRAIEALIWAIIFSVWVGIGPFAGMLALMIHSVASLAKQYSEMVETVSEGPIEGIQSTGATKLQTVWFAVVPQVILPYISFTVYRWDINVRMATIIGLVGGGGIGTMLIQYQGQAMWPEVGCIILVIAVVVWGMDQASSVIREALK
ncbi:MAG: phosphonate ABC transporter, permease protein PhnE [Proteobacteria bacterium]|nr:MAG: phosphonate ABC transporter, permease protein PhnE [Pseudomonadota bacterium]